MPTGWQNGEGGHRRWLCSCFYLASIFYYLGENKAAHRASPPNLSDTAVGQILQSPCLGESYRVGRALEVLLRGKGSSPTSPASQIPFSIFLPCLSKRKWQNEKFDVLRRKSNFCDSRQYDLITKSCTGRC